jgi:hypothetical protein
MGIDLEIHQQGHDHPDYEVRGPFKTGNWRPITPLGSIYNILAETLAKRIQEFLPFVITPNQTGFVQGRSILDNNFLA